MDLITVLSPEQQADQLLKKMLTEVASLFPITHFDDEVHAYSEHTCLTRKIERQSRSQITVVRSINGGVRIGSHTEEEEAEAKQDPDLQFVSSWSDALLSASGRAGGPDRIVSAMTHRWTESTEKTLILFPDSVARQQYIQFCPGLLFLVMLDGKLVNLPVEALYPWEYYSRTLPQSLADQQPPWPNKGEVSELIKDMILKVAALFPLEEEDRNLIKMAKAEIGLRYAYGFWQLASAFVTEKGNIRAALGNDDDDSPVGIQHDTKTGRANMDAEQSAIKKARRLYPGEHIKTIVTVHHSSKNFVHEGIELVSSCALCRKSLLKFSPQAKMIIPMNGQGIGKVPVSVLYPLPDSPLPQVALAA